MFHRCLVVLALGIISVGAYACSHDAPRHRSAAHHPARTSGAEQARAQAPGDAQGTVQVTTHVDDMDGGAPTAMDQSESAEDLEITRQIRSAVVGDSALSFSALNCTIITRATVVTLRGSVTRAESVVIERHAHEAPGVTRVNNMFDLSDAASAQ